MTQEEFQGKINATQLTDTEKANCIQWFNECKGKKVQDIAEGEVDNILLNANRFVGRKNAPKKEKVAKATIDYDFSSLRKAINAASYDELLLWKKEITKLNDLVTLCINNKEYKAYNDKKSEVEKLIKQLNEMRSDVKVSISTEQNQ